MQQLDPLNFSDIQHFLDHQPEQLANQSIQFQIAVANHPQTPRQLLEVLANSPNPQVAQAASLHVNLTGEITEGWQEMAQAAMKNASMGQNDRLVVELLRFTPVPDVFISEWIPGHRLIQGIENSYMPQRYRVKLLERLALSPIIEERLKAVHPETPRSSLEQLAGDLELPIRIAVKFHPNSPTNVIELVESQHEIAQNWNTDPQKLTVLADSRWSWIRLAVARNPYTQPEILAKLARDTEEKIQLAVARNLASPADVLDLLVNHYYQKITAAIAKHPNASEQALVQLIAQQHYYIAKRFNLPANVLEALSKYNKNNYQVTLIHDPNTPGSALAELIDCPQEWRYDLAKHPNVLVSTLEQLALDSYPWVRVAVFQNPKTPEPLRNQLLEEFLNLSKNELIFGGHLSEGERFWEEVTTEDVWKGLAESENTPTLNLERLASRIYFPPARNTSQNRLIAIALIGNPNTPVEIREELLQQLTIPPYSYGYYRDWQIYLALAFNSAIPEEKREEYFQQIIADNSEGCRRLARHPKTPAHILEQLATTDARDALAENPHTPPYILRQLAQQQSRYTRGYVAKNPSTPPEVLVELINQPNLELGDLRFRSYGDWIRLAFEYPNVPKLELYRRLLDEEAAEEAAQVNEFMASRCLDIPALRADVFRNGDRNSRLMLAHMSDTPVHLLEQLAQDSDDEVRATVSHNPNLPLSSLIELTKDRSVYVRRKLVSHNDREHTPVEILEALKSDEAQFVRVLVAINKNTPPEILRQLANDSNRAVMDKVVSNPNTPVEVLESLWREHRVLDVYNRNTPSHVLAHALTEIVDSGIIKDWEKLSGLLQHPNTPGSCLEMLASYDYVIISRALASNPNTPTHILEQLANHEDFTTRRSLAQNRSTPANALEGIFRFKQSEKNHETDARPITRDVLKTSMSGDDIDIFELLATNPNTPLTVLETFINREFINQVLTRNTGAFSFTSDTSFLQSLAYNPSLTPQLLERLALDPSPDVRRCLINHPHITSELWMKLAHDESSKVRQAIASYRKSPATILEALALDEEQEVRQKLASNFNTPISILAHLAKDTAFSVRLAVAANNNTLVTLLEQLAQDDNLEVLKAITHNPNTPRELRQSLQYRLRSNISPTLSGLSRLYNKETDDLPSLLSEYVQSSTPFVRLVSLMHPLTPVPDLNQGSQSLFWLERYAVANNRATPVELRQKLAQDSNRLVRAVATHLLNSI